MNKFRSTILLGALLACAPSFAQTTNGTFFSSVTDYFSSFNTNNDQTFAQSHGKLFTGVASIQGGAVSLANVVGLTYDIYKPTNSSVSISIGSETLNSGIAGTLVSQEIGPELNFIIHDVELTAFAHAGYDFTADKQKPQVDPYFGAFGLRITKALTTHTYAGTELAVIVPQNAQRITAIAGFTF